MDQVLAEAKVEISPTSKVWEPQRAYEKRLSAIMAKDNRTLLLKHLFLPI
jgi:cohesin complex subunit SA-1/2